MTRASGLLARPLPKEPAPRDEVAPRPWLLPWTLTVAAGTLGPYLPVHPDQGLALLGPWVPIWKVGGFKLDHVNPLFSIPLARSLSPWFPAWSHPASSHFLPSPGRLRSGFAAHPLLYLWLPAPPCSCSSGPCQMPSCLLPLGFSACCFLSQKQHSPCAPLPTPSLRHLSHLSGPPCSLNVPCSRKSSLPSPSAQPRAPYNGTNRLARYVCLFVSPAGLQTP